MIEFLCPHCGNRLSLPDHYAGQAGACSHCEEAIEVPLNSQDLPKPELGAQPAGPPPLSLANRSSGLAVTSLVLSVVSYLGLTLLTAIPGIITGHVAVRRAKEEPEYYCGRSVAWVGIVLGYLHVIAFCLVVGFIAHRVVTRQQQMISPGSPVMGSSSAAGANARAMCQNNLKQLGLVVKMFANESPNQVFPALSSAPGKLMFEQFEIYPEYLSDMSILLCPGVAGYGSTPYAALVDDHSYYYLGYVFTSEAEIEAFASVYEKRLAQGLVFDDDFDAPQGKGSGGSDTFYRLREGVEQVISLPATSATPGVPSSSPAAGALVQSRVPIMIERPGHHQPLGSNVLFMDGHVEFLRPGSWPVTNRVMQALQKMDDLSGLTPLELQETAEEEEE